MIVYRISHKPFIEDISGTGAWLVGGRWNSQYKHMLYTSESLALAALEILVNIRPERIDFETERMFATIYIPDDLPIADFKIEDLPNGWNNDNPPPIIKTLGNKWLDSLETLVLKVPSAVIPSEFNYLINPKHPDFHWVQIKSIEPFHFDKRLFTKK